MFVSNLFNGEIMKELNIDEIAHVSGGTTVQPVCIGIVVCSDPVPVAFYPAPLTFYPAPAPSLPAQG